MKQGLIGGSIAGIVFAFVEMLGSVLMGMPFLMPFQVFASIPLGILVAATLFGRLPSAPRRAWSTT